MPRFVWTHLPGRNERLILPQGVKFAIVAALEREAAALIRSCSIVHRPYAGRTFRFFEQGSSVVVCGGIGPEAARRATEAVIECYQPESVLSVGFAGALDPELRVADVVIPSRVVDLQDGSTVQTEMGLGTLISCSFVADSEQKARLARSYKAHAVDMEAAAVARAAATRSVRFAAIKVISDEIAFAMLPLDRFIAADGSFRTAAFVFFVSLRPWLWPRAVRLARNSRRAANALCRELERLQAGPALFPQLEPEFHSGRKSQV